MGRMFRVITEGPIEAVTAGAALAHKAEEPFVHGSAPYIEVGGRETVFHAPKSPRPAPIEQTPPPLPKNRDYLNVALQSLGSKPASKIAAVAADVVAFHHPEHPVSTAYRELANEIEKALGLSQKAIAFASAGAARGTTTVVVNLGVTLAKTHRVLVIDADFEHGGAARKLGASEEPGLAEALAHTQPLAWLIQPTAQPNLHLLASGKSLDVAHFREFDRVLATLRHWYDVILVDTGVLYEQPARDTVLAAYDAVYAVARAGENLPAGTTQHITRHGGLVRGCITTQL